MDAYNANPSSMKAAIENFAGINAPQKVFTAGRYEGVGRRQLERNNQELVETITKKHIGKAVILVDGDFCKSESSLYLPPKCGRTPKKWVRQQGLEKHLFSCERVQKCRNGKGFYRKS